MKGDLHVHSKYSTRPSQWILRKLGCPESFTSPGDIYRIAKSRGMDIITITDHNTINGVLEIADLPGVIISEEVTTYFPEDGCKIHVLVYGITEEQHRDIQKIRENIYDLVSYLNHENIIHAVAHPLFGVNDKLTIVHFEKLIILFRIFELNGSRNHVHNLVLRSIFQNIDHEAICRFAEDYKLIPFPENCSKKVLIGGSDDHSGLNIARFWTEVPGAEDVESFLKGLREGNTRVGGTHSTPLTMARNLYSIAYQYYQERLKINRYLRDTPLAVFLDRILSLSNNNHEPSWSSKIIWLVKFSRFRYFRNGKQDNENSTSVYSLVRVSHDLIEKNPLYSDIVRNNRPIDPHTADRMWFQFISDLFNSLLASFSRIFVDNLSKANFFDVFGAIGATGAISSLAAPYVAAFSHFSRDYQFAERVRRHWETRKNSASHEKPFSIGHFSDTVFEINGVAKTLMQIRKATLALGYNWTIITSSYDSTRSEKDNMVNFPPVGVYELPEYPEIKLAVPPFLDLLEYCFNRSFSQLHAATPGPLGIAALLIARILSVPIVATYHTAIPQYVLELTGDENLESAAWKYVIWYYGQMDYVFVPSNATAEELVKQGLPREKLKVFSRGVDIDLFHPRKASREFRRRYGIEDETVLLYVGRISKEKGLDLLARAFKILSQEISKVVLLIVGDGPYLESLKKELSGTRTIFTGYLSGEELATAYASSDIFVFPSATDTFGNVVLEAQASGLPVIVSDKGGPKENIIPGKTGLVFRAGNIVELIKAMSELINNVRIRHRMGAWARYTMKKRSFMKMISSTWELYQQVTPNHYYEYIAG